jgi:hypothetical protein
LGKVRNIATKNGGHGRGGQWVSFDGNKGAFVEVDGDPDSSCEVIEDTSEVCYMLWDGTNDDKGGIDVLEDRAWKVAN